MGVRPASVRPPPEPDKIGLTFLEERRPRCPVTVGVEAWATGRLADYTKRAALTRASLMFDGVTARRALDVQKTALKALKLDERYTLHDARHSYAVRQMKNGVDPQIIAHNLRHKDALMMLKVYGKYRPTAQDLARAQIRAVP